MNITKVAIERPSLIIVLFSVLILLGFIGYKNLGYELMPDFSQPVVVIKTIYMGADPQEVETSVSRKIEDALSNLEGIDYLLTKSLPNASIIIVNLKYGTNLDKTMQAAQRYIDNIRKDLPKEILNPVMSKISPNDLPIMLISATSKGASTEFFQKMKDVYLPLIQQQKGISEITLLGGDEKEIQVNINQAKLELYKISLSQVVETIHRSGLGVPAGKVQNDKANNSVRLTGKFLSLANIQDVQLAMPYPGSPIYVKDVATIVEGLKETTSISRYNGNKGIGLLIKKQGDANAVEVSKLIRKQLHFIEQQNKDTAVKFIIADDSTDKTIEAVHSVIVDLGLAVILVSLVMLLFLKSLRNSLIVLVSIPISLVAAFAVMWLMGFTLNIMTLLAMSLIIGILVDDATVILENIQRHVDKGKDKRVAALDGRMEIGYSALSITLVDVVVFVPILFLQVFVADILIQFSIVVITSTLTSLLVGFTLTPLIASRIGIKENLQPTNPLNRFLLWFEDQLTRFINAYGKQLIWVLRHKLLFSGMLVVLFVLTIVMMKQGIVGKEMMASGDQGKFRLNIEFDQSTAIQQNDFLSKKIEQYILNKSDVQTIFSNIGGPYTGIGSLGIGAPNKTELTIQLKPINERNKLTTEAFMKTLREELKKQFPGVNYSIATIGLIPRAAPIEITLSGANFKLVTKTANQLKSTLEMIPGADNVRLSVEEGSPEYVVIPDSDKMQRFGLNTAYVGQNLRTAFTGNDESTLIEKGIAYPVHVQLDQFSRKNYEDVVALSIITPLSISVKVSQFAKVEQNNVPSLLERKNRQPSITLTAESLGRPSGTLAKDVIAFLKKNPLPRDIEMTWGGDISKQNESFGALGLSLLISFILIYLILVALYNSFLYPFVVLFSIPAALIGALFALNFTRNDMTLFALLGLLMLMGLVAKNAILIVDFTNQLKAQGKHFEEALILAGKGRMRPILMTTLSMVIGMLPIALAKGMASEWKNGLAWVIIGGLISSLILTVYWVPMVYFIVDTIKEKIEKKSRLKYNKFTDSP